MKWKPYKESCDRNNGGKLRSESKKVGDSNFGVAIKVFVDGVTIVGDTVEDALSKLREELRHISDEIEAANSKVATDGSKIVKKYDYWNKENDGDVWFNIYESPYVKVDLENEGV